MRLCRFGNDRLGLVDESGVRDVTAALDELPAYRYPLPAGDVLMANLERVATRARAIAPSIAPKPADGLDLLSPVANPSKIIGALEGAMARARAATRSRFVISKSPAGSG